MFAPKVRIAVIACTFLALPASQSKTYGFFHNWFGSRQTYYAPVTAAYAPSCCPQPVSCARPVVAYRPQTCYRTVYQNVPVVAYRPMTTRDPCTGCQRTVMRPVTSYVRQARLVPYTSYRPVVTTNYAPPFVAGFAPAPTTVGYPSVTAYSNYAAPTAAPACCAPSTATGYAPSGTVGSTVTRLAPPTTVAPSYSPGTTPAPSMSAPAGTPTRTFESTPPAAEPESRLRQPLKPLDLNPSNTLGAPRELDPEGVDRMTALPLRPAFSARLISNVTPATQYSDNGWRASSK